MGFASTLTGVSSDLRNEATFKLVVFLLILSRILLVVEFVTTGLLGLAT